MENKPNKKDLVHNQSNGRGVKKQPHTASTGKNKIKPFDFSDIETVAELSQQYFPMSNKVSKEYLKARLTDLYLKHDRIHPDIHSFVSRNSDGGINGFLGVTGKRFYYKGREIIAALCNHLMATETGRSALVPMRLLQQFLKGPQEFSFADGSVESSRKIWERLGGETSVVNSIYYKIPLRPFSFISRPVTEDLNRVIRAPVRFISKGVDLVGGGLHIPLFYRKKPNLSFHELDPSLLLDGLNKVEKHYEVFPQYDSQDLRRLLQLLEVEKRYGALQKYGLKDSEGNLIGWFIYYSKKGDVCEVVQAVSIPGYENKLFQMLAWHAWQKGGIELSGKLMNQQIGSKFTGVSALSMPGRMWTLIHSSDSNLKLSIQSGKAFLTRLEGDLWLL